MKKTDYRVVLQDKDIIVLLNKDIECLETNTVDGDVLNPSLELHLNIINGVRCFRSVGSIKTKK